MKYTDKACIVMIIIALVLCLYCVYMQTQVQAAEFRAHIAEELLEKSQDAVVNSEVSQR